MSNEFLQYRILPNNGSGWYWEVVTTDREVIARGVAETHAQARDACGRSSSSSIERCTDGLSWWPYRRMARSDMSPALAGSNVDEALAEIECQRELIAELVQLGQPTEAAEQALKSMLHQFAYMIEQEHGILATALEAIRSLPDPPNTVSLAPEPVKMSS
jgi:hypothetical protein